MTTLLHGADGIVCTLIYIGLPRRCYIFPHLTIRKRHIVEITSLRGAGMRLIFNLQIALRLPGVGEIKPRCGFFVVNVDNPKSVIRPTDGKIRP